MAKKKIVKASLQSTQMKISLSLHPLGTIKITF